MPKRLALSLLVCLAVFTVDAQDKTNAYLSFVRAQASQLRQQDKPPATGQEWAAQKVRLREELLKAWGQLPLTWVPLEPKKLGEIQKEGYRVEKLIFQTLPNVWMTANAYIPDRSGKLPALLMVHGHWRGAKQDPVVQSRCIGAARLGFFVLVVDAFGAGERGVGKALGEYHGDMTAATLLPVGLPLSGLQVYENMRAVDYLQQRPEVDPDRIGISGASGGGNQTMYASAWDERFKAAVPVCSVGNYRAYLGAACCMCEVVPGALRFTEEWAVLGLVAPRALMVINATRDARQFSVAEAQVSLEKTKAVFELLGKPAHLRHTIFESGHDYSQPMREAVYGWMALHLKGQGEGNPIPEQPITPEDPESLRCFPGDTRPDDWITIPRFAAAHGRRLLEGRKPIESRDHFLSIQRAGRKVLSDRLLGGFPPKIDLELKLNSKEHGRDITFTSEPGIILPANQQFGKTKERLCIIIDLDRGKKASASPAAADALSQDASTLTMDLRATGDLAWSQDKVGRAPDHTSAQWGLWIGRPLLGQWVWDIRRLLDALQETDGRLPREVKVVGVGPGGLVALAAAALDDRITAVTTIDSLGSFISETPYQGQRMGTIVPGIVEYVGDVPDLAALVAPKPLTIQGAVSGNGEPLKSDALQEAFRRTRKAYSLLARENLFQLDLARSTNQ